MNEELDLPKFDPSKHYKWDEGTKFLVEGGEFGAILNGLRIILSSPEAKRIFAVKNAHDALMISLERAVEVGLVKEEQNPGVKTPS